MDKQFIIPKFPLPLSIGLLALAIVEIALYGVALAVPLVWVPLIFGAFYLGYRAFFRRDSLPVIFAILFFTAFHSLVFNFNRNLDVSILFLLIFLVSSAIMWVLLHYATHLKSEHHIAYSLISGFMIAQIMVLFAAMARDWAFRFELAAYMVTVFSYVFWRFACLSADAMLGWKQFTRVATLVVILVILIILGSPNTPV